VLTEARLDHLILYVSDLDASRDFYERALGFRPLASTDTSVDYSAGHVTICLHRAADYDVELPEGRDRSIDITFHVDDLDAMRAALEGRGVRVSRTLDYEVGKTADFYDPDGHWFSLYEPSEVAMTWPSGDKIRELQGASNGNGAVLDGHELVYLFVFVEDPDATVSFYNEVLGIEAIEGAPCRRGVTRLPEGVVKYDAGATLLTTHAVDDDHAQAHRVSTRGSGALALVFRTRDVERAMRRLSERGVEFTNGVTTPELGPIARFRDPAGHLYYLSE
jgi:catechol 2,3-dioxygenase-like lactoylglutathione lyase family enzyme